MKLGYVKEIKNYEFRVEMTPDNAKEYALRGHYIFVETGAGAHSGFTDDAYAAAGATLISRAADVWSANNISK